MFLIEYKFGTPNYCQSFALRNKILRIPLGLEFTLEQLNNEWEYFHAGFFDFDMEPIACVVTKLLNENEFEIYQIVVDNNFQKQGIGKKLILYAEKLAKKLGASKVILNARKIVVPFYEKCGYTICSEMFIEIGIPHFRMEKPM